MKDQLIYYERYAALQRWMMERDLKAFIVVSSDPHGSEYLPDHWKGREWLTGFSGSAGTAVVTVFDQGFLWTDSRYFLQAAAELEGGPFKLMKQGQDESVGSYLGGYFREDEKIGIDGRCCSVDMWDEIEMEFAAGGVVLVDAGDPFEEIWSDRPPIPQGKVKIQPVKFAGLTAQDKIRMIRTHLKNDLGCYGLVVSQLDDIAWLLNLRGSDVEFNPVFVAYALLLQDSMWLYIDENKLTGAVRNHLKKNDVVTRPYEAIYSDLATLGEQRIMVSRKCNRALMQSVRVGRFHPSPITHIKAMKSPKEIAGFRRAMERDGVALCKFMRWLKPAVRRGGVTEIDVDRKLHELRSEQDLYMGPSFGTIAAYGEHGAIVHYEATEETNVELKPRGLLLLDTGAQYQDGTTDITRTIPLGPTTQEEKAVYTFVLKAHIALAQAVFPEGISGTNIDAIGRKELWRAGLDYGHGTGHGVGSYLCVHEGPHQIRKENMPAPIYNSMTVTNEPGIYMEGKFGVRIENVELTYLSPQLLGEGKRYLMFEPLTLCPIDREPILTELLHGDEIEWIDRYHEFVRARLEELLDDEADRRWLRRATRPLLDD